MRKEDINTLYNLDIKHKVLEDRCCSLKFSLAKTKKDMYYLQHYLKYGFLTLLCILSNCFIWFNEPITISIGKSDPINISSILLLITFLAGVTMFIFTIFIPIKISSDFWDEIDRGE